MRVCLTVGVHLDDVDEGAVVLELPRQRRARADHDLEVAGALLGARDAAAGRREGGARGVTLGHGGGRHVERTGLLAPVDGRGGRRGVRGERVRVGVRRRCPAAPVIPGGRGQVAARPGLSGVAGVARGVAGALGLGPAAAIPAVGGRGSSHVPPALGCPLVLPLVLLSLLLRPALLLLVVGSPALRGRGLLLLAAPPPALPATAPLPPSVVANMLLLQGLHALLLLLLLLRAHGVQVRRRRRGEQGGGGRHRRRVGQGGGVGPSRDSTCDLGGGPRGRAAAGRVAGGRWGG